MKPKTKKQPLTHYARELTTCIGAPSCVKFLPDNTVFLNGSRGFIMYNHETKKELIRQFRDYGFLDVATNADKTKIAISADKTVIVYNTKTGNKEWQRNTNYLYLPIAFNLHDDNELISHIPHKKKIITITTTSCREHRAPQGTSGPITPNPLYNEIIYPSKNSFIIFSRYEKAVNARVNRGNFLGAECSLDSKFIAANYKNDGCYLFNGCYTNQKDLCSPLATLCSNTKPQWTQAHYIAMAFHPNNTIALLAHNNILEFWHCDTCMLVKTINLNNFDTLQVNGIMQKRLDISPDGTSILVALQNKCLILPMPFETFYQPGTAEKLFTRYCLLRNYTGHELPKDIVRIILNHYINNTKKLPYIKT